MNRADRYKQYFTGDYLMGPNSFRLLDELIRRNPYEVCYDRTLDLGCGMALTSVFLARVYRYLQNAQVHSAAIASWYTELPDLGALDMPFPQDWFDAIVSVDSYHYFGCKKGIFADRILPFVRRGGSVMIVVPGLREEPQGEMRLLFESWAEGDDSLCFKTLSWWKDLLEKECGNRCDITVLEAECCAEAWEDWFSTGHEYGIRDRKFLSRGLDQILNFSLIYVRRK